MYIVSTILMAFHGGKHQYVECLGKVKGHSRVWSVLFKHCQEVRFCWWMDEKAAFTSLTAGLCVCVCGLSHVSQRSLRSDFLLFTLICFIYTKMRSSGPFLSFFVTVYFITSGQQKSCDLSDIWKQIPSLQLREEPGTDAEEQACYTITAVT